MATLFSSPELTLCVCVHPQVFPALGCQPPAGRNSAATGAGACSIGRQGSPCATVWRCAGPATCLCAALMGGSTGTTASFAVQPACWARELSVYTARTASSKVGKGSLFYASEFCDGSSDTLVASDNGAGCTDLGCRGSKEEGWYINTIAAGTTCIPPKRVS